MSVDEEIKSREYTLHVNENGYHFIVHLLKQHIKEDHAGSLLKSLQLQKAKTDKIYSDLESRADRKRSV